MTASVTHTFVSAIADTNTPTGAVGPDEWNATHTLVGAALSRVDDTNVTLALSGSPSTALIEAVTITAGWTGTLAISRGGTGVGTGGGTAGTVFSVGAGATTPAFNSNNVMSGYLRVGSAGVPTNTSAGDLTVGRLIVTDGSITSSAIVQITRSFDPGSVGDHVISLDTTATPGAATDGVTALHSNMLVSPTAANGSGAYYAVDATLKHLTGAFNISALYAVEAYAEQGVASSTVTSLIGGLVEARASGGTATVAKGLDVTVRASGGTITTGVGVDITRVQSSGTFTTGIGLRIAAASGTIGTDIAIQSLGGQNRFVGNSVFGSDSAPSSTLHVVGSSRVNYTATTTGSLTAALLITGTRTNDTDGFQNGIHIDVAFNGSGDEPGALFLRPTFTPSANLTAAYGGSLAGFFNPAAGKTITRAVGFRAIIVNTGGTGAITTAVAIRIENGAYATITPTNAVGLHIDAMTGGTNNYDMSFGTVDTTAAGAYYGRIPVLYNGLKKYLHVFSA